MHDTIFCYAKSADYTWSTVFENYDPAYLAKFYRHSDERGSRSTISLVQEDVAGTRVNHGGELTRIKRAGTGRSLSRF